MPALRNVGSITLGNGDLFVNTTEALTPTILSIKRKLSVGGLTSLAGVMGALKGDAVATLTREVHPFEMGTPQQVYVQQVIREGASFKCSLAELNATDISKQLGGGTISTDAGGQTLYTQENTTLTGTTAAYLDAIPLQAPTAPANPVVTSNDATPVTYVEGVDYTINYTTGTIVRIGAGSIPSGSAVDIAFYYTALGSETLLSGGSSDVTTYFVRFVHPFKDGRVLALDFFKANPSGTTALNFPEVDWSQRDVEFVALADTARAAGSNMISLYREKPADET